MHDDNKFEILDVDMVSENKIRFIMEKTNDKLKFIEIKALDVFLLDEEEHFMLLNSHLK